MNEEMWWRRKEQWWEIGSLACGEQPSHFWTCILVSCCLWPPLLIIQSQCWEKSITDGTWQPSAGSGQGVWRAAAQASLSFFSRTQTASESSVKILKAFQELHTDGSSGTFQGHCEVGTLEGRWWHAHDSLDFFLAMGSFPQQVHPTVSLPPDVWSRL